MPSISQKESRSSTTSRTESGDIRIAAIDIGSNSIRQIIADVSPTGTIRVVDEMKAAPRLGAGIHETGELSREAGDAAIEALGRMEALARQLGARRTRAVATSAVRDAGNSDDWLARVKLEAAGIHSSLRQGDMYALPLEDGTADSIIIHQVLHYAHSPAAAIAEAARVLAPGGTLLVVDFAAHDREELRATDAHIRLGFEDEVMKGWFASAGLEADHVEHLKGGELTVTLWRGSKKPERERRAA